MLIIFTEEGPFTMNKKKYLLHIFIFIMILFVVSLYRASTKYIEIKRFENENLKEELQKMEREYLKQKTEKGSEEEKWLPNINCLEGKKKEKEKRVAELEKEIQDYEQEKENWNRKIEELETKL